jgi:hypothetical protein
MKLSSIHYAGLATILFENLVNDFGFVIGRADKRYTLWKYTKSEESMTIAFVHVLSDNRTRVEIQYPDVYICEELRGEHRMVLDRKAAKVAAARAAAPKTPFDFTEVPFGEIRGMKIKEANEWHWVRFANSGNFKWTDAYGTEFDFEELVMQKLAEFNCEKVADTWYTPSQIISPKRWMYLANTTLVPEHKAAYDAMCVRHGLQKLMGRWFMPIALEGEKPWMTTARQILPLIENGNPFSFVPHFNGNDFFFGIPVKFREEDKKDVYTYYGSSHMLLITNKKGVKVAKRTKGKTIEVLEYEVLTDHEGNPYVMVNKFNIK